MLLFFFYIEWIGGVQRTAIEGVSRSTIITRGIAVYKVQKVTWSGLANTKMCEWDGSRIEQT